MKTTAKFAPTGDISKLLVGYDELTIGTKFIIFVANFSEGCPGEENSLFHCCVWEKTTEGPLNTSRGYTQASIMKRKDLLPITSWEKPIRRWR